MSTTSKNVEKTLFFERPQKRRKNVKKGQKWPKSKNREGVSWYPQNRHFSSKLHSGKTPKSRKIGQKSPFFRGPKTPKNRPFLDPIFRCRRDRFPFLLL